MKTSFKLCLALEIIFKIATHAHGQDFASFVPRDPWRSMNGQTNYVKLDGVQFCGKIVDVTGNGIRIEGQWGYYNKVYYPAEGWGDYANQPTYMDFFVANYPYEVANNDIISSDEHAMAWYVGTYTYDTAAGGSRTIRKLDYGIPCDPDPDQIAALQQQEELAEKNRHDLASKQLEEVKIDATNGDSGAQYSLGIHYWHGIGMETNQANAVFWLTKSAAKGNLEASNDLQEIESQTNRPTAK